VDVWIGYQLTKDDRSIIEDQPGICVDLDICMDVKQAKKSFGGRLAEAPAV